jgi:hypothetical protein
MARRPEFERILTKEELQELENNLLRLSVSSVRSVYETAYRDCRYVGDKPPPAVSIQQLVCSWRVLRRLLRPNRLL